MQQQQDSVQRLKEKKSSLLHKIKTTSKSKVNEYYNDLVQYITSMQQCCTVW